MIGAARLLIDIQEHDGGKQLVLLRSWSRLGTFGLGVLVVLLGLSAEAGLSHAVSVSALLGGVALLFAMRAFKDCAIAMAAVLRVVEQAGRESQAQPHEEFARADALSGELAVTRGGAAVRHGDVALAGEP